MQQRFVILVCFTIGRHLECGSMRKGWNFSLNNILYTMYAQVGDNVSAPAAILQTHAQPTVTAEPPSPLNPHHTPVISLSLVSVSFFVLLLCSLSLPRCLSQRSLRGQLQPPFSSLSFFTNPSTHLPETQTPLLEVLSATQKGGKSLRIHPRNREAICR